MASIQLVNFCLTASCLLGIGLSIYAYFVELAAENDDTYVAMCDISEHMSCTKAFTSKYGKGFGLVTHVLGGDSILNKPNSLLGIIYYSIMAVLVQLTSKSFIRLSFLASILSCLASIYFACILIFILYDFCVVCVLTYVVNFTNFGLVYYKLGMVNQIDTEIKKKEY